MPFVSRRSVPLEVRQSFEKEYKAKLRQMLNDPSTSESQRVEIRKQLDRLQESPPEGDGRKSDA